jgi:hypothetical protein
MEVSGTITLNGQAPKLKNFEIFFICADGSSIAATIDENGAYTARNMTVGEAKVAFVYSPNRPSEVQGRPKLAKPGAPKESWPKVSPDSTRDPIPERLRDQTTSQLTFKVQAGQKNVFDYDIK